MLIEMARLARRQSQQSRARPAPSAQMSRSDQARATRKPHAVPQHISLLLVAPQQPHLLGAARGVPTGGCRYLRRSRATLRNRLHARTAAVATLQPQQQCETHPRTQNFHSRACRKFTVRDWPGDSPSPQCPISGFYSRIFGGAGIPDRLRGREFLSTLCTGSRVYQLYGSFRALGPIVQPQLAIVAAIDSLCTGICAQASAPGCSFASLHFYVHALLEHAGAQAPE